MLRSPERARRVSLVELAMPFRESATIIFVAEYDL
jgi:hypothetical protein